MEMKDELLDAAKKAVLEKAEAKTGLSADSLLDKVGGFLGHKAAAPTAETSSDEESEDDSDEETDEEETEEEPEEETEEENEDEPEEEHIPYEDAEEDEN